MRVSCAINVLLVSFLTHYTKYHSKGTQDATFVSSSAIEDHGPEHVDDNTPKTFWESAATKKFSFTSLKKQPSETDDMMNCKALTFGERLVFL